MTTEVVRADGATKPKHARFEGDRARVQADRRPEIAAARGHYLGEEESLQYRVPWSGTADWTSEPRPRQVDAITRALGPVSELRIVVTRGRGSRRGGGDRRAAAVPGAQCASRSALLVFPVRTADSTPRCRARALGSGCSALDRATKAARGRPRSDARGIEQNQAAPGVRGGPAKTPASR